MRRFGIRHFKKSVSRRAFQEERFKKSVSLFFCRAISNTVINTVILSPSLGEGSPGMCRT